GGGTAEVSNARARDEGYRRAIQENGLECRPELMVRGDYRFESGHRAGLAVLPRRPDAVLVTNYLMTVGLMRAAEEMGLVCPEDFALVSFDDYPLLGASRPRVTPIDLPKYALGEAAVLLLLERLQNGRTKAKTIILQPQLRVRESC